jgi:four helix bundle protein
MSREYQAHMARDKNRLKVFHLAHQLALTVRRSTRGFPAIDRDLQWQLRRAAVSASANIVEGCARRSHRDYLRFLDIALGSASEADYLLDLCSELTVMSAADYQECKNCSSQVLRALQKLIGALEQRGA